MSVPKIATALAQLQDEINSCEKALLKLIRGKKTMSINSLETSQMNTQLQQTPVAVVGMASIFPQAKDLQEYWEKIIQKVDCITDVPATHWDVEAHYDPDPKAPDKTYCKRGGFIPEIEFNPLEFGLPPNLIEMTDVSQLLSLIVAKQAMEDAGYSQSQSFDRDRVGVILGSAAGKPLSMPFGARLQSPVWEKTLKSSGLSDEDVQKIVAKMKSAYTEWEENAFPGMLANVIAGRIANRLDLGGTNCTIDAACASSLAAFKMAVSELLEGHCDMMLTGGVDTDNSIFTYLCFSKTPALSKKQQIRPFDADSDGMMLGEGLGMMVLKRLEDAERDGDNIYAVIKGIGTSSDGKYKSIYAPRPEGQVKALRRAYQSAGVAPTSVGLIEAHGTGTMAGDPAEFIAIQQFFGENNPKTQHIALGSVKSQIGHTKAAAGAASLIKAVLALHHKVLPPTINVTKPNPRLKIESSPFYLNTETRPWIQADETTPRRAGVSSFGFGGTNYHVVLEEYRGKHQRPYRLHGTPSPLLLHAPTPQQLLARCEAVLGQLQSESAERHYAQLLEECKALEIPVAFARVGFVAASVEEARNKVQTAIEMLGTQKTPAWEHPQGIYYRQGGMALDGKVVALFSGQGSQYLEMGRELTMNFPSLSQVYGQMDGLLSKDGLKPLSEIVFPAPAFESSQKDAQVKALQRTEYAQPAIGAFSVGLYKILQQAGFQPNFVAGHSFGELTALWAAGVLSEADYCFLVKARGQAMATPDNPTIDAGTMLAVKGEATEVEACIQAYPQVAIANFNSGKQVVLAGAKAEIAKVQEALTAKGFSTVPLPVSAAFHTPLVAHAQTPFAQAIESVTFNSPQIPVYTNVTGDRYPSNPEAIGHNLKAHLSQSVLFKQEIEKIYEAGGSCFVEFGPRSVLTHLVKDILGERPHLAIALNASRQKDSDRQLREAAVQLRVAGLSLKNLDPYQREPKVPQLPARKSLTFRLNGANYVSDKTKQAFVKALQDGHRIQLNPPAEPKPPSPARNGKEAAPVATNGHQSSTAKPLSDSAPVSANKTNGRMTENGAGISPVRPPSPPAVPAAPQPTQPTPKPAMNYQRLLESLEYCLTQFNQHQSETLQVHGQYLNHQMEYAKLFFQLMQQQNALFSGNSQQPAETRGAVIETLERSMMRFHDHQADTLRAHEQSLTHQADYAKNFFQLMQQQYSLLLTGEAAPSLAEPLQAPIDVTSRQERPVAPSPNGTGKKAAPVETAKPVARAASAPTPAVENGLRLVKETPAVAAKLNSSAMAIPKAPVAPEPASNGIPAAPPTPEPVASNGTHTEMPPAPTPELTESAALVVQAPEPTALAIESSPLSQILLAVVSEKTGYPPEMLELEMDMEADLGIDSIKRVEIFGALQEQFPEGPQSNPEDLAELRTLGEIVGYLQGLSSGTAPAQPMPEVLELEPIPVEPVAAVASNGNGTSVPPAPVQEEAAIVHSPPGALDASPLSQILLTVVSEKTGYPTEMLELEMDMEADLGIDSIKRVEIFGALQEQFPEGPQSNPEDLAELRTLGEIVGYLQQAAEKKSIQSQFALNSLA
jgi:acyl transferase domain-containing protein